MPKEVGILFNIFKMLLDMLQGYGSEIPEGFNLDGEKYSSLGSVSIQP